jgi:hypothetical protein
VPGAGSELAAALEPALIAACGGRLSPIEWFRSTWQAGGASTGYAAYTLDTGERVPAVVKLPVGPGEFAWTTSAAALADADGSPPDEHPTLRPYAAGTSLGGYDLAWLVVERLPGPVLNHDMTEATILDLLRAAARWYALASRVRPLEAPPPAPDWGSLLDKARDAIHRTQGREGTHDLAEPQRWNHAVKQVQRILPTLVARWSARPINAWCHGDLHPGNAMRRAPAPGIEATAGATPHGGAGPCVLLDLALVHAGHWVEDAVYLERLYWGRPELLAGVKPVSALSKFRKELGLHPAAGDDYPMLANIRRVLMAASAPAFLHREGHPRYMHHALEVIERLLPLVSR